MAVRNPQIVPRTPDGVDFDDMPIMVGGDRSDDPAPYSNRLQLYAKRDGTGYLDAYIKDEFGLVNRLTQRGGAGGVVNVRSYGAVGDGVTDDTVAINTAIAAAHNLDGIAYFPAGTYLISETIELLPYVTLEGAGMWWTALRFTGTGPGLRSTSPINSSTAVSIRISDMWVDCSNANNADAGIVDVGGTYIDIRRVQISGFLYGIVLDQSELVDIDLMYFGVPTWRGSGPKPRGIWIVNGPDYSVGANPGFTNRICVTRSQFNSAAYEDNYHIVDDGGGVHTFKDNNFNAAGCSIRACGVISLNIDTNESEGHKDCAVHLLDTTLDADRYVSPCQSVVIKTNAFAPDPTAGAAIKVTAAFGGEIVSNIFANTNGIYLIGNPHKSADLCITRNQMNTFTDFGEGNVLVADAPLTAYYQHNIEQTATTVVSSSLLAGARTVTPASMFGISVGKTLICMNDDGTNFERVNVTGATDTTFDATFASNKSSDWKIQGIDEKHEDSGTWTPTLLGEAVAGSHTYSVRKGTWHRIGKKVHVSCNITVSALDGAISGQSIISGLPFTPGVLSAEPVFAIGWFQGLTLPANYTTVWGYVVGTNIYLGRSQVAGGSVAPVLAAEITGTFSMYFEAEYIASL